MDLVALADFTLVAAHGGFGRASRATGRPKATLSRRVAELEAALGVQLLERGARSLRLTEAGAQLQLRATHLLGQLDELGEAVTAQSEIPRGRIRISAPVVFTQIALSRIAARFVQDYPEVDVEIVADERYVDPVEEGFDLVIRANPALDDRLVGRRILRDERLVVASPALRRPDQATGSRSLAVVNAALLITAMPDDIWRFDDPAKAAIRPKAVLRLSSLTMVKEAVLAGAGAGILPRMLAATDLERGSLVNWGMLKGGHIDLWALHSSGHRPSAKIRIFLDYLVRQFPDQAFKGAAFTAPPI